MKPHSERQNILTTAVFMNDITVSLAASTLDFAECFIQDNNFIVLLYNCFSCCFHDAILFVTVL